jgi:uncharacterized protein YcfL
MKCCFIFCLLLLVGCNAHVEKSINQEQLKQEIDIFKYCMDTITHVAGNDDAAHCILAAKNLIERAQ